MTSSEFEQTKAQKAKKVFVGAFILGIGLYFLAYWMPLYLVVSTPLLLVVTSAAILSGLYVINTPVGWVRPKRPISNLAYWSIVGINAAAIVIYANLSGHNDIRFNWSGAETLIVALIASFAPCLYEALSNPRREYDRMWRGIDREYTHAFMGHFE